jgi:hypothetical protein
VRWTEGQRGGRPGSWTQGLIFHELVDDNDHCLGWVREDTRCEPPLYMAALNNLYSENFPAMPTLEEAKAQLIHHFVVKRMEDT